MSLLENVLKKVVLDQATIIKKEQLSAFVYKVRLKGDSIKKAEFIPGYFLRLGVGIGQEDLDFKDKVRSYSVWNINKEEGWLDLAIATESNGVGANWVMNCNLGDLVYYKWKKGNFLLDNSADNYLMIGDLSALSHLYVINRNLPKNKSVESVIYSNNASNLFNDIDNTQPLSFYEFQEHPSEEIKIIVKEKLSKFNGSIIIYISGDSRVCVNLNQYLKKVLGYSPKQLKIKPFWNPLKKGLE